jgi:hypothetical protein
MPVEITNEMLEAALKKAVEAGLLSRRQSAVEIIQNKQVIREILNAVLQAPKSAPVSKT